MQQPNPKEEILNVLRLRSCLWRRPENIFEGIGMGFIVGQTLTILLEVLGVNEDLAIGIGIIYSFMVIGATVGYVNNRNDIQEMENAQLSHQP